MQTHPKPLRSAQLHDCWVSLDLPYSFCAAERQCKSKRETFSFQEQWSWNSLGTLLTHLGNYMGASSKPSNSLFPNSVLLLHASLKQGGPFTKS